MVSLLCRPTSFYLTSLVREKEIERGEEAIKKLKAPNYLFITRRSNPYIPASLHPRGSYSMSFRGRGGRGGFRGRGGGGGARGRGRGGRGGYHQDIGPPEHVIGTQNNN